MHALQTVIAYEKKLKSTIENGFQYDILLARIVALGENQLKPENVNSRIKTVSPTLQVIK